LSDPISLLIAGAGRVVERLYGPALRSPAAFKPVAVVDPRPERRRWAEQALGVRSHGSLTQALDRPQPGAALVTAPPGAQIETVKALLAAGVPVLSEKPLARTVAEAQDLLSGLSTPPLRLALSRRYWRRYRELATRIAAPVAHWEIVLASDPSRWGAIDGAGSDHDALIDDLLPHAYDIATAVLKLRLDPPSRVQAETGFLAMDFDGESPGRISLRHRPGWEERVSVEPHDGGAVSVGASRWLPASLGDLVAVPRRLLAAARGAQPDEPIDAARDLLSDFAEDLRLGRVNGDLLGWAALREAVARQVASTAAVVRPT
jgi:predicted dehydrogenase